MNAQNFKRTKYACYYAYLAMSSVFCLPPILFVTFREMYGISYTLLGTLVLVNFCTQLSVDLLFTFFTKYFNPKKVIRVMPLLTSVGLLTYALVPTLFPQYAYAGLLVGTVIFSVAAGLCEVLLSPTIAALPSDNPQRDMSMLHSLYALGVFSVVTISTIFLNLFGTENWMYLTMFWAFLPVIACVLFCLSPMPDMELSHGTAEKTSGKRKNVGLALCALCLFLGSCAENAMTNWISAYLESALQIPKTVGDILGLAVFALLLALGRILYAKYGKNISSVLLWSMIGATLCYLVAGFSANAIVSTVACVLTGFCTSMLWPGTLILMEEEIPNAGVMAYALMAAGGDLGGSVGPQMLGAIVDAVAAGSTEQMGMKVGILTAAIFPLLGVLLLLYMRKYFKKA